MKKYFTLGASFVIMLCIGSVYAWSIIASELIEEFSFSAFQAQLIFGTLIAVFPVTMIGVGKLSNRVRHRYFGLISGILFFLGYYGAGWAQGDFILTWIGIGLLAGIATGFGYWVALTAPVQWFPQKKGLITGIAAAGFGLGAVQMSMAAETILGQGYNVLELLKIIGIAYGLLIALCAKFIYQVQNTAKPDELSARPSRFMSSGIFWTLFVGLFLGTFSGLVVIGNLKMIGGQFLLSDHNLILGVSIFAVANFLGRLIWGGLSDYIGARISIFFALLIQSAAIFALNLFTLTEFSYLLICFAIGFGFGGNFVLFAKETAQQFGLKHLGIVYPYVFVGYAVAGVAGPISGGVLFDHTGSFSYAIALSAAMSFLGSIGFISRKYP